MTKAEAMVGGAADRLVREIPLSVLSDDAGFAGVRAAMPSDLAPADPRERCNSAAAGHLREMTRGNFELLPEWLELLSRTNLRVPEELIPDLLDAVRTRHELRTAVQKAAGPIGAWLARFNERWDWAVSAWNLEADWHNGIRWQRLAALREIRATDPARARELLAAAIAAESSDLRREFLECLQIRLSPEDEPFLEKMLDDRSSSVRGEAAYLLVRIPGTQIRQRMLARIQGRVKLRTEGLLLRKKVFDVELFDAIDDSMRRDGVVDKIASSNTTMGERAFWTGQILARVDPAFWTREFSMRPASLIETAREGQWSELLVDCWRAAARFYGASDWLETFAAESPTDELVFEAMPVETRERIVMAQLKRDSALWVHHVPDCCPHDWSLALTEVFLRAAAKHMPESDDMARFHFRSMLDSAARLANCFVRDIPDRVGFAEFGYKIRLRREMREALGVGKDKE